MFQTCLHLVQSYVKSVVLSHQSFFTEQTSDAVRAAVLIASVFFVYNNFDFWNDVCNSGFEAFVSSYSALVDDFMAQRQKSFYSHYDECDRANCSARASQVFGLREAGSSLGVVVKEGRRSRGEEDKSEKCWSSKKGLVLVDRGKAKEE